MQNNQWLDHSTVYAQHHSTFYRWILYPVIGVLVLGSLFLFLGKTEVVIRAKARITSLETKKLQTPINAKIKENHLTENKEVKKGELLLSFDTTGIEIEKQQLEQQNTSLQEQQQAIHTFIDSLNQEKNLFAAEDSYGYANRVNAYLAAKEEIQESNQQLRTNQQQQQDAFNKTNTQLTDQLTKRQTEQSQWQQVRSAWAGQQALAGFPSDITSKYQTWQAQLAASPDEQKEEQKANILSTIDTQLSQLKNEIEQLQLEQGKLAAPPSAEHEINGQATKNTQSKEQAISETKQKLSEITETIAHNNSSLQSLNEQLKNSQLLAPSDGVLHLNEESKNISELPKGSLVAELYPNQPKDSMAFTAQIPANQMSHVKIGMPVHFKLDKKGVSEKSIDGTLTRIAETSDLTKDGAFYQVEGQLSIEDQAITRYGLTGDLSLVVGKKSYWQKIRDILLNQE
ncbi:bacteriocin secretion accessory protein [Enterococcus sp. AZ072]|uniref:bacteriocin secretion accessory protein n=1 Tax=unclassified Enterococcus TaxID=2608891 RepID=UPI003D2BE55A